MNYQFRNLRLLLLSVGYLQRSRKNGGDPNQGYVLVVVVFLGVALLGLVTAYAMVTRSVTVSSLSARDSTSGFYAAESGMNLRAEALREEFEGFNRPSGTAPTSLDNCTANDPNTANDFRCIVYNFRGSSRDSAGNYSPGRVVSTYAVDTTVIPTTCPNGIPSNGEPCLRRVPAGDQFQNLNMQEYTYEINSVARKAVNLVAGAISSRSPIEATVKMTVRTRLIPMFQFAVFYRNNLEISPGPFMRLDGPVHTNGRLMLAGWASTDVNNPGLRINGQVTTAQQIYNAVVPDNCGGNCTSLSRTQGPDGVVIRNASNTAWLPLLSNGISPVAATSGPLTRLDNPATNVWGSQVQTRISPVVVPATTFLGCNSADPQAVYCALADINIRYQPPSVGGTTRATTATPTAAELSRVPLSVTGTDRSTTTPTTTTLTLGQLRSLRQPVLVIPVTDPAGGTRIPGARGSVPASVSNNNLSGVCAADTTTTPYTQLNDYVTSSGSATDRTTFSNNRTRILNALRVALASQLRPVEYNRLFASQSIPNTTVRNTIFTTTRPSDNASTDLSQLMYGDFYRSLVTQTSTTTAQDIIRILRRNSPTTWNDTGNNPLPPFSVIASIAGGGCYVSAPFQDIYSLQNDRENREMRLLQMNVASLTVWNKQNWFVNFNGTGNESDTISSTNNGVGFTTDNLLFNTLAADSTAPADSFQRVGYAASDRSQGGMVVHMTIDQGTYTYAGPRQSPYGFIVMGARQLFGRARVGTQTAPNGVTFASDQAIYLQGDFNNFLTNPNDPDFADPGNTTTNLNRPQPPNQNTNTRLVWQPAAVMTDSLNILSNNCRNTSTTTYSAIANFDRVLKTGSGQNCNNQSDGGTGNRPSAVYTSVRAGLLSGTDISGAGLDPSSGLNSVDGFSGGVQNYPRFTEDWGNGNPLLYYGSFVSLGIPLQVNGRWDGQAYNPPRRIWGYDDRFNDASNLPPLTPRFIALQQDVFTRQF